MDLYLKLATLPSARLEDCIREAIAVSARLEIKVEFNHNGISLVCSGTDKPDVLLARYRRIQAAR